MTRRLPVALTALLLLPFVLAAKPDRVIDGDTLEVAGERIRIWGVDAVEGRQICQRDGAPWRCGDDATAALEALVLDGVLVCDERDVDRYGRTVATCTVGGVDIGSELVRQGWALDYENYSKGAYAIEQLEAEAAQRGLWSGSFVPPWEWRKGGR